MLGDVRPFKMAGNLYFVGTFAASSHMLDTGDGLILIDVGYESTADVVIENLQLLGYRVEDVKLVLLSHGHGDHSDGVPKIIERSGAKCLMHPADQRYLKKFTPDGTLEEGQVIRMGNTEILCLHTPGHTMGTMSFFFNLEENGKTYRAGMFGGAGIRQMKKDFLDARNLSYMQRWHFYNSIRRLKDVPVDIFVGNHARQNDTVGKQARMGTEQTNPFIDPAEWVRFLDARDRDLDEAIQKETVSEFVNYAHRGASAYAPENTMLAFYTGIFMGANGIETDVRRTKDGQLVLFHDNTLERVCGESGSVADYTYEQLQQFYVKKGEFTDKIPLLEDFLQHFAFRDLTFAIELKDDGIEEDTARLLREYGMEKKCVVTSFSMDYIRNFKAVAPEFRVGYLTGEVTEETIRQLRQMDASEICPKAEDLTAEQVYRWHREGFRVRAWGVKNAEIMRHAFQCGVDGMTVNFPDLLTNLRKEQEAAGNG